MAILEKGVAMFVRSYVETIKSRILESEVPYMQVVVGPRQTGKSTMIAQALEQTGVLAHSVSADDVLWPSADWIQTEWQQARVIQQTTDKPVVLVLDEIQKVEAWPNVVKGLYDADRRNGIPLKIVLSGSSSMLIRKGLEDSLKGRYELIHSPHWSYAECQEAFGFSLDDYLIYGGFPGAAPLIKNKKRWLAYMRESIIEPTISTDVLAQEDVRKPALMRALFGLGAQYSAQELSYTKMLGQLQDAGNTTTLAHYLTLLDKAGMLCALEKYHPKPVTRKKSSPRLMVYDPALLSAASERYDHAALADSELKGRIVESAVGAYFLARSKEHGFAVQWWRDGNYEVDFVLSSTAHTVAVEVKSGRKKQQGGMAEFLKRYPHAQRIVIGGSASGAYSLEDCLLGNVPLPWE